VSDAVGPPRVSVVMPVYNGERFVARAVRSVLVSTFADLELLVLDDGSEDASPRLATEAAAGDPRFRVVTLPHGGIASARNSGLREARSALIANADADDVMLPDRIARQVAYLDAHPECVAVSARSVVVDANEVPLRIAGRYFAHEDIDHWLLGGHGGALGGESAMFRTEVARRIGGYADHLQSTGEDHDLWLRMAEVGRLAVLPEVLTLYRLHGTNVSMGSDSAARRLPITLDNLARAFARRGITDRQPAKLPAPPLRRAESLGNAALIRAHRGDRLGALTRAVAAVLLDPRDVGARAALTAVSRGRA
jgi:glycosyltransferase involved in cell wall biosynthesis